MSNEKKYRRNLDMPPGNALCESYSVLMECIAAGVPVALVPIPSEHESFKNHGVFALPADAEYGFHATDQYAKELGKIVTNKEEPIPGMIAIQVAVQANEQAKEMAEDAAEGMFDVDFEDESDGEEAVEWNEGFMAGRQLAGDPSPTYLEGWNAGVESIEDSDLDEES